MQNKLTKRRIRKNEQICHKKIVFGVWSVQATIDQKPFERLTTKLASGFCGNQKNRRLKEKREKGPKVKNQRPCFERNNKSLKFQKSGFYQGNKNFFRPLPKNLSQTSKIFFVVLACHNPVLDGLNQQFQATVLFPLSSTID